MISPDASLAFWGQTLEELWLLWWQPHVASRTHGDSSQAGLAETPHVTSRSRGDSSRAGLAETRHKQDSRRLVVGVREVHRHLEQHSISCYFGPHYRYYLVFRITTTKMCTILVGVYLRSLTSGICGGSYWTVEGSSHGGLGTAWFESVSVTW